MMMISHSIRTCECPNTTKLVMHPLPHVITVHDGVITTTSVRPVHKYEPSLSTHVSESNTLMHTWFPHVRYPNPCV